MANLTRTNMRTRIAGAASTTVDGGLSTTELNDAISQAVSEMSRHVPLYLAEEIQFEEDVTAESVTSSDDTEVALANKPVKKDSETVENSGQTVTYTADTDYEIDYINGRIKTIGAGAIPDATTIKVTYKFHPRIININSVLTRPIRIYSVEFPIGSRPPTYVNFEYFGDLLMLDKSVADEAQIRIWHTATWIDPADSTAGVWPEFLDEIVVLGATGYALLVESIQQQNAGVTELTSATTAAAKVDDHATKTGTALDAANTSFDNATTALARLHDAGEPLVLVKTALDKVDAFATADMNTVLDRVTGYVDTDAELSYNKVSAITDLQNVAADKISAIIDLAATAIGLAPVEVLLINDALDKIVEHLETDATNPDSAEAQLATGDSRINAQNTGKDVPELYAKYAEVQIDIARGFAEEAAGRVAHVQALVANAAQDIAEAEARVSESNTRIAEVDARIREGDARIDQADANMREAGWRFQQAMAFIEEAQVRLAHAQAILDETGQHIAQGVGYLNEASARNDEGRLYAEQASVYTANAAQYAVTANLLRVEALSKLADFRTVLKERALVNRQSASFATMQHLPQSATTPHPSMG